MSVLEEYALDFIHNRYVHGIQCTASSKACQTNKEFTPDLMVTKYEADLPHKNIPYIQMAQVMGYPTLCKGLSANSPLEMARLTQK